jgi:hypothetical protein
MHNSLKINADVLVDGGPESRNCSEPMGGGGAESTGEEAADTSKYAAPV